MSHVRRQIRDKVTDILKTGVALVRRRVLASRVYPLTAANIPAVLVYTRSEGSGLLSFGPAKSLDRRLSLSIDVYVRATETFDNDLDAICVQVEETIAANFTLDGLAKEAVLTGTEIDYSGEAEQPVAVARLTYAIRYVTTIGDVETAT